MSKKLHEEHKELMHYTNESGLLGIVASKTLWASQTSFLNDSEEVVGFLDGVLPEILRPEFARHVAESEGLSSRVRTACQLGMNLFDYWFRKIVDEFKEAECRAQDHYVTSFCTTDAPWISNNGLLSQWRGYGPDGGYAIIFDTEELESLLTAESKIYHEESILFGSVQYDMAELSNVQDEQVLKHVQYVKKAFYVYLETADIEKFIPTFERITILSVLCKHRGFAEEKEVRIVVSEPSAEVGHDLSNQSGKPYRREHSYFRDGAVVPCIHLFEDQALNALPIRRVIIGPHPEKQQRKKAVGILLRNHGIDAEVLVSDTPFRGR
jgi:hypothetical protein